MNNNLGDYRGRHQGKTIVVCGCGESLNTLPLNGNIITIGVNDVGRLFDPTYLVVLNHPQQFKLDRYRYVRNSKASAVFSQLPLKFPHPNIIKFKLGQKGGTDFSKLDVLPYTQNSPYVAVCLAAYMGAKRIGLIGVDFTDNHFFDNTGKHVLSSQLEKIDSEYLNLFTALKSRGVELVNLSSSSRLTSIKKLSFNELYNNNIINICGHYSHKSSVGENSLVTYKKSLSGFNVVHVSKTNCAGAIRNLSEALNKYTEINSRVITGSSTTSGLSYPKDVLLSEKRKVCQLLKQADLIHFHNNLDKDSVELQPYRHLLSSKPAVLQYHSEPDLLARFFRGRSIKCRDDIQTLVVAQKHIRFYPDSIPVPNIIDIYNSELMPVNNKYKKILTIMYCPTDEKDYKDYTNTCCGKGYTDTLSILNDLKEKGIIKYIVLNKVPWLKLMKLRSEVDVLIDECVTGGYHMTSLEGLSQGLATIACLDELMIKQLCDLTGSNAKELPWLNTKIINLREQIIHLAENPSHLDNIKEKSRKWVEKYWSPEFTLACYLKIYYHYGIKPEQDKAIENINTCAETPNKNLHDIKTPRNKIEYSIIGNRGGRSECYPQKVRLLEALLTSKQERSSVSCHILGNGPSVSEVDLSLFSAETVIGVNASPLLHDRLGRATDYYCVTDRRFFEGENINQILKGSERSVRVFAGYCSDFVTDEDINYVKICGGDGISGDVHEGFYHGCSVVLFASQLAMWLGYKNIYLYGCEFNYGNGRFYNEARPMPFDKNTYPRIVKNFKSLKTELTRRGGSLNVVGPSRLVGDYGSIPILGVRKISQSYK